MKEWLFAGLLLSLASLAGCAHQTGGYAYGGFPEDECGPMEDCYGGPQYTCVFYQPAVAPARMEISLARHAHSPRIVGPREGSPGMPPPDSSAGSSSTTASAPPPPPPLVAREPVILVSPPSPRTHN